MSNIAALNYSTAAGTLFYSGRFTQFNSSSFPNRCGFVLLAGDVRAMGMLTTVDLLLPNVTGGAILVTANQSVTRNSDIRVAWSFDAALLTAEVKSTLNGGAIVNSSASALTASTTPDYFMLGQNGYGAFFPAGTVRQVKYWPTVLPTATMQSITA